MNSNLYERKKFLNNSWPNSNSAEYFTKYDADSSIVVQVNLLRATANEANALSNYLVENLSKTDKSVIIDLSNCTFIDSTFLSTIVSFNSKSDSKIKLVVSDSRQFMIFKITKLDTIFSIYSNLNQALVS